MRTAFALKLIPIWLLWHKIKYNEDGGVGGVGRGDRRSGLRRGKKG